MFSKRLSFFRSFSLSSQIMFLRLMIFYACLPQTIASLQPHRSRSCQSHEDYCDCRWEGSDASMASSMERKKQKKGWQSSNSSSDARNTLGSSLGSVFLTSLTTSSTKMYENSTCSVQLLHFLLCQRSMLQLFPQANIIKEWKI